MDWLDLYALAVVAVVALVYFVTFCLKRWRR